MKLWLCCFSIAISLLGLSSAGDIPDCPYEDTVNITASQKFDNGSYLYEGVLVPASLTGIYTYEELFEGKRLEVAAHVRGCVCQVKRCVKFCCHPKSKKLENSRECATQLSNELQYSPWVNVTLDNGSRASVHVLDEFVVQQGIPCHDGYMLTPQQYDMDNWELFENGTLLRLADEQYLTKRDYCFQSHEYNGIYLLNPMNCPTEVKTTVTQKLNTIIMCISIPFLLCTILIYRCLPQLWNLHAKRLICYLLSLSIGYFILVLNSLESTEFSDEVCSVLGFTTYYFLMAAFFWLNVICFDLWHNFCGTKGNVPHLTQRRCISYYALYAWGVPILLTGITILCQFSDGVSYALKPGIGDYSCWIKTDDWSAMIYFYGPSLLLIISNISMFFLTAMKIYKIRKELQRISEREKNHHHLRSQQNNVWLFLRLFIVMGVGWILEVASYLVGAGSEYSWIFYVTDIYNAAQGIIIFVLLVLKKKVLTLLKHRVLCIEGPVPSASTESECSQEEIALQNRENGIPEYIK